MLLLWLFQEKLDVKLSPGKHLVKIGSEISFRCDVTGQALKPIYWLHNGSPIQDQVGKVLKINTVQSSDQGVYQCFAKNAESTFQASSELILSGMVHFDY